MYFITICTENKRHMLCSIVGDGDPTSRLSVCDNIRTILTPTGEIVNKYILSVNKIAGVSVDKYVIMPNHIHLIVQVDKPEYDNDVSRQKGTSGSPSPTNAIIPRTIGVLKRLINKDCGKNIFQRSFHDHIIRNEYDYEKIWEYIDTNPLKWKEDCFFSD